MCCPVTGIITHIVMEILSDLIMLCCVMVPWTVIVVCFIDYGIYIINGWVDIRQHKGRRPSQSKLHWLVFLLIACNKLCLKEIWNLYLLCIRINISYASSPMENWKMKKHCTHKRNKCHTAAMLQLQLPHTHAGMHVHTQQTPAHSHACTHTHVKAIGWAVERPFSWWRLLMATR